MFFLRCVRIRRLPEPSPRLLHVFTFIYLGVCTVKRGTPTRNLSGKTYALLRVPSTHIMNSYDFWEVFGQLGGGFYKVLRRYLGSFGEVFGKLFDIICLRVVFTFCDILG